MGLVDDIVKSIIAIANSNMEMDDKEKEIKTIIEPFYIDSIILDKLHAGGVDNWDGYEFSLEESDN